MNEIIYSVAWQITGVILFLSVCTVIGLNMTVFADIEEEEECFGDKNKVLVYWNDNEKS
jgi:hypothetical protein